jgi:hypothetical protein
VGGEVGRVSGADTPHGREVPGVGGVVATGALPHLGSAREGLPSDGEKVRRRVMKMSRPGAIGAVAKTSNHRHGN